MKVNWRIFQENSSTMEAVNDFAKKVTSIMQFEEDCWPKDCKKMVRKMRKLPVKVARKRAQAFLSRACF